MVGIFYLISVDHKIKTHATPNIAYAIKNKNIAMYSYMSCFITN